MTRHHARPPALDDHAASPLGRRGEAIAAAHLQDDDGLRVVARNWRLSSGELRGELDLVALDDRARQVVVVEVKTRRGDAAGGPLVAVTSRKQARIRRLAAAMLLDAGLPYRLVRFDVVGLWLPDRRQGRLEHLEAAF